MEAWLNDPNHIRTQINNLKKWNSSARTSSKLLLHLVNDILDLARLENEAFKLNIEPVLATEIMKSVKELFIT